MSTSNPFSNITRDGRPLDDVLTEEAINEMHEALSDAAPRISRRSAGSKHKTFTNGISRNLDLADKQEPDFTQWVLINNVQYLRAAKEPFRDSGKSLFAALQYDPDTDKIKCHECGDWFVCYGVHRRASVGHPSGRDYKIKHNLDIGTKLAGIKMRENLRNKCVFSRENSLVNGFKEGHKRYGGRRAVISQEKLNAKANCELQIKHRLKLLADELGRTPTLRDAKSIGIRHWAIYYIFGSFNNALRQAGLKPTFNDNKKTTNQELLVTLLSFKKVTNKWPTHAQLKEIGISHTLYPRRFGSMKQAIAQAESRLQHSGGSA